MATYVKIASYTAGASEGTSITLSSIPGTYTDLMLKISAKDKYTGANNSALYCRFNSDSGTNYLYRRMYNSAGSSASDTAASQTSCNLGYIPTADLTNQFGICNVYMPNYTWSNPKVQSIDNAQEGAVASTGMNTPLMASNYWTGTSAITSITIYCGGTAFAQYSLFDLYGIKST
jgi:hypothetical protein